MVVVRVISNSAALSAPRKAALKEEKINSFEKRKQKVWFFEVFSLIENLDIPD